MNAAWLTVIRCIFSEMLQCKKKKFTLELNEFTFITLELMNYDNSELFCMIKSFKLAFLLEKIFLYIDINYWPLNFRQ